MTTKAIKFKIYDTMVNHLLMPVSNHLSVEHIDYTKGICPLFADVQYKEHEECKHCLECENLIEQYKAEFIAQTDITEKHMFALIETLGKLKIIPTYAEIKLYDYIHSNYSENDFSNRSKPFGFVDNDCYYTIRFSVYRDIGFDKVTVIFVKYKN